VHKGVNNILRSFDLKNNDENLGEDNPFDYFLQSTAWLPSYQKHLSNKSAGNTMSTYVWKRYDRVKREVRGLILGSCSFASFLRALFYQHH
jgi:hypothetical protein